MNTILTVQNLKCGGCAHTIATKFTEINDVSDIVINQESSNIFFAYTYQENSSNR